MLFIRANSVIEIPKHKQVINQNKQETGSLQTGLQNKAKVHLNQLSSSLISILCIHNNNNGGGGLDKTRNAQTHKQPTGLCLRGGRKPENPEETIVKIMLETRYVKNKQ